MAFAIGPRRALLQNRSLLRGLVSVWPLQFPTGGVVDLRDRKSGNTLTDNGTVTTAAGPSSKMPRATHFDAASTQSLDIAAPSPITHGNIAYTLTIWVKFTDLSGIHTLLSAYGSTPNSLGFRVFYRVAPVNNFRLELGNGGGSTVLILNSALGLASVNVWYFVRVWFDPAPNLGYIQINDGAIASATPSSTPGSSSKPFHMGCQDFDGTRSDHLTGDLGLGTYHQRILTPTDHSYLYNGGLGRAYNNAQGFY